MVPGTRFDSHSWLSCRSTVGRLSMSCSFIVFMWPIIYSIGVRNETLFDYFPTTIILPFSSSSSWLEFARRGNRISVNGRPQYPSSCPVPSRAMVSSTDGINMRTCVISCSGNRTEFTEFHKRKDKYVSRPATPQNSSEVSNPERRSESIGGWTLRKGSGRLFSNKLSIVVIEPARRRRRRTRKKHLRHSTR